ncbi:MAG: 4Fe-4S binding protein [Chromatiaceae bacterium]|jgi:polyferredoxin|nr:4Fe-4S binding protein [Chromatiaceae bacterium]
MSQRLLKPLRVGLALAVFVATAALFLDLTGRAPGAVVDVVLYVQPTPSLVRFAGALGWAAAGFLVVLLVTLVFGRVFCSTLCPLGTLQDAVIRLGIWGRVRRRRLPFRYRHPRRLIGYGLLAGVAAAALGGLLLPLAQLDPFSHFGRIVGLLARPLAIGLNNLVARALEAAGSYALAPVSFVLERWEVLLAPLAVLGLLVWMAARHGRLFCNSLCPVGTLLGLVGRFALLRIAIDQARCDLCARCSMRCKAQCIDLRTKRVDFERCVACFNCIPACPEAGIGYRLAWGRRAEASAGPLVVERERPEEPSGAESDGRRGFLRAGLWLAGGVGLGVLARAEGPPQNKRPTEIPVVRTHPVAPPGAGSIRALHAACTACQLCVSACPTGVLQPALMTYGARGLLNPHLAFELAYCTFECIRCGEVCPTHAIRPLSREVKKTTRIGTVRFIEQNCVVVAEKTDCGACAEHCPTRAVSMIPHEDGLTIPELQPAWCIGCGACEYACPVRPHRAIYVDGEPEHQVAELAPIEALEQAVPADFPF